jgi:hypothetical protein
MKKLALLLLVLPLTACAAAPMPMTVSQNCSSWTSEGKVHETCAQDSDISGPTSFSWRNWNGSGGIAPLPTDEAGPSSPAALGGTGRR